MRAIFVIIVFFKNTYSDDKDHPPDDINDLFPIDNSSSVLNNNIALDIGKIDVKRLAEKIGVLNDSVDEMSMNDARRQVLKPSSMTWSVYRDTTNHMAKQRTTDLMLQIIYMARHMMQELEANPNFKQEDTGFKIGMLYSKLLRMAEDIQTIYTIMHKKTYLETVQKKHLQLHHRSVKLHTEFNYIWWVLIKVDEKFKELNGTKAELPQSLVETGGLTDDEEKIG